MQPCSVRSKKGETHNRKAMTNDGESHFSTTTSVCVVVRRKLTHSNIIFSFFFFNFFHSFLDGQNVETALNTQPDQCKWKKLNKWKYLSPYLISYIAPASHKTQISSILENRSHDQHTHTHTGEMPAPVHPSVMPSRVDAPPNVMGDWLLGARFT